MPLRPQTLYPSHAKLHPAINGANVAVLSADNPQFPAEMNGEDALKRELERLGYDYEITNGKYGAPERSFIVMNPDLPAVLDLGRKFGQESVAWSENGKHQLHYTNGEFANQSTPPTSNHEWSDSEPQDNYTAVPSPRGEPWGYFTWNMDFDNPKVPTIPQAQVSGPVPEDMSKSESPLAVEVRKWVEALGELRARELAKAEQVAPHTEPGVHEASGPKHKEPGIHERPTQPDQQMQKGELEKVAPPGFSEKTMRELKSKHGTKSAFKIAWAAHNKKLGKGENPLNPTQPGREGSQVNIETGLGKKPEWKPIGTALKGEDAGSVIAMVSGDVHKMKKSDGYEQDTIRRVREAESKELANIPFRDPSKGPRPDNSGPVRTIAEERNMRKAEHSKVDPLDADAAGKHACASCKSPMSPVVAALRKARGGMCLKCEAGVAKAELKYHNNEPRHGEMDNAWKPTIKEPCKAPGSGGIKKAEGMPVPAAPKPPQAPGAKPSMAGGMQKALGEPEFRGGRKPVPSTLIAKALHKSLREHGRPLAKGMDMGTAKGAAAQASYDASKSGVTGLPAVGKLQPKSPGEYDSAAFRPASPGAVGAPGSVSSGLELDTTKRTFAQGHNPVDPSNPLSTQPKVTGFQRGVAGPKQASPIGAALQGAVSQLKGPPARKITSLRDILALTKRRT
jgi:hypothetical protein